MAKVKAYNKHSVLLHIFNTKVAAGSRIGDDIHFTLADVSNGITATGGTKPTSTSNFVLDLTRKKNPITSRLPQQIIDNGYDLRKKTGRVPGSDSDNYCGTFVYRGKDEHGNTIPIQDWLEWDEPERTITITNVVPDIVQQFISDDEASLFSVMDYCNVLSTVFGTTIYRVQSPMKWQPNEIDGYYVGKRGRNTVVYPVEAKAISTGDDINLVQMYGQYKTFIRKYSRDDLSLIVRPVAAKMEESGMLLALLEVNPLYNTTDNKDANMFNITEVVRVVLDPPVSNWKR